jgi:hypothetical protein
VFIVINGKVILKKHEIDDPYASTIQCVAKAGSLLGVSLLDCGISCMATVWSVVGSNVAHFIKMQRSVFDQLWHES